MVHECTAEFGRALPRTLQAFPKEFPRKSPENAPAFDRNQPRLYMTSPSASQDNRPRRHPGFNQELRKTLPRTPRGCGPRIPPWTRSRPLNRIPARPLNDSLGNWPRLSQTDCQHTPTNAPRISPRTPQDFAIVPQAFRQAIAQECPKDVTQIPEALCRTSQRSPHGKLPKMPPGLGQ